MGDLALMFHVKDGGVSDPVKWSKDNLQPDRSIIVLDESSASLFLWHGQKQGLVQRRTALRQAQSLKGHGYTVGKSIIGRDTREIIEIDARKVGRVPDDTDANNKLEDILSRKYKELNDFVVTFDLEGVGPSKPKPTQAKAKPITIETPVKTTSVKPVAEPMATKATVEKKSTVQTKPATQTIKPASEYEDSTIESIPVQKSQDTPISDARIGLLLVSILDKYDDIWISKKSDGNYSVEMMDGPICSFKIVENAIKFTQNSFSGISTNIKNQIKKKYADLAKLL
ncbi:MAG: hypothetical protein ACFFBP_20205 [Promethearchaeota archaeon]